MVSKHRWLLILCASVVIVTTNAIVAEQFIDPIWHKLGLHIPGENIPIDHKAAVDTVFYIRNAASGFVWDLGTPVSSWFHPLLTWLIRFLPIHKSLEIRGWFISLVSVLICIPLVFAYMDRISSVKSKWYSSFLIPFLPGGISMVTGNAEWLCLLFTSLLLISFLNEWPAKTSFFLGGAAILVKPNALYLVPMLIVYSVFTYIKRKTSINRNAVAGAGGIILIWLLWIIIVDWNLGLLGGYWEIRKVATVPLSQGPLSLLYRATQAIVNMPAGEKLRYITALSIPLIQLWITIVIPLRSEVHRLSIIAGYLAVLLIAFYVNNPNKIIVYTMTFPAHFASGILFIETTIFQNNLIAKKTLLSITQFGAGVAYLLLCLSLMLFFLIGTPLEWYY